MLTPQDVTNRVFDKAVFGGYDIAAVDTFLEQLTQDYTSLYRENAILKNKLRVLVDKVEEYRSTEDAMRMALLSAKKTAKELEEEARQKCDKLLADAEASAEVRRQELKRGLEEEEAALLSAKRKTAAYLQNLKDAIDRYQESLTHIYDFVEPLPEGPAAVPAVPAAAEAPAAPVERPQPSLEESGPISVASVAEFIEKSFESPAGEAAEAEPEPEQEVQSARLPHIDYDNLQFGDRYSPGY